MECAQLHEISVLLTGFTVSDQPIGAELTQIHEQLNRIEDGIVRVEGQAAETAESVRRVMRVISTEVTDCPRLFTLTSDHATGGRRARVYQSHYRLILWCEHPGYWHPWPRASYELDVPKDWFAKICPYAILIVKTLQLVVPLAGSIAIASLPKEQIESAEAHLELMKVIVDDFPKDPAQDLSNASSAEALGQLTQAEGQALRALRAIIFDNDKARAFGGLRRVQAPSGEYLWVCGDHYSEYDPGLPAVP
jgi:hypothetical protein